MRRGDTCYLPYLKEVESNNHWRRGASLVLNAFRRWGGGNARKVMRIAESEARGRRIFDW